MWKTGILAESPDLIRTRINPNTFRLSASDWRFSNFEHVPFITDIFIFTNAVIKCDKAYLFALWCFAKVNWKSFLLWNFYLDKDYFLGLVYNFRSLVSCKVKTQLCFYILCKAKLCPFGITFLISILKIRWDTALEIFSL